MENTKIKKCCPNCSQLYNLKALSSKSTPNIPLFLPCGHTVCEKCVRSIVKFEEPVECKVCGESTHVSPADILQHCKTSLYSLFPINVHMVGELTLQDLESKDSKKHTDGNEHHIDIKSLIKNADDIQSECVECHRETSKMCVQCGAVLCDKCFTKIHKNVVFFKSHVLQNIVAEQHGHTCEIHNDKALDYYCTDCKKSICIDCTVLGGDKLCKNHSVISIQEANNNILSEIGDTIPKVEEILKRITKSAVDVGNLLTKYDNEPTSSGYMKLLNAVEEHFSKVNAIVQKQKCDITTQILKLKNTEKESLNEAKSIFVKGIKRASSILNTLKVLDLSNMNKFNLATLLEDVKEVMDTPWYLNREEAENTLNVKVNDEVYQVLTEFMRLEGNANPKYGVYSTKELVENNVDIPQAPASIVHPPEVTIKDVRQFNKEKEDIPKYQALMKEVPKYRSSKSGSCSSLNSINSDSLKNEQHQPQTPCNKASFQNKLVQEGCQELIYVSHIVDPHSLFVQRASDQPTVQELLREFRNAVSLPKPSPGRIVEGKVYLVYNKADHLWQRGRVLFVDKKEGRPAVYHVLCIDFGCTELVSIDQLRLLQPARAGAPPLSVHCRLANCEPVAGAWTCDDAFLVQKIIDNKRAVLYIRRVHSLGDALTLECDITTFEDGVGLASALAFHGRARIPRKLSQPKIMGLAEKPKLFMNNTDYKRNSVEEVVITHVINPDTFFVRKRHHESIFRKLCDDLDDEYSLAVTTGSVYLPEKDMVCVANVSPSTLDEASAGWARAVVLEAAGRGRVRVLLPDVGARVLVHWTALRRIADKFTTLRALATECHLSGVTPLNKRWSPVSVSLLESFRGRHLELHVEENRTRGSLGVTLYDKSDEDNVSCVNVLMIKHKLAIAFGIYMFNKNPETDETVHDKVPLEELAPRRKTKNEITILKRQSKPQQPPSEDLVAKDKGTLRIEAKVLNCQSPSLVYVSLVHQQKVFSDLFEKIQKYYTTETTEGKSDWEVEARCCTLCAQSKTWRRAAILEIDGGSAKVFYSDFACVETVPVSGLRALPAEFASVGDAAIMCHLRGIIPAGDEWPSLTKEYLKELIDTYKRIFITKLGKFKGKSMPIELWVYHTIQGGALEPDKSEWRCLNKRIVEQGLAIPDTSEESAAGDNPTNSTEEDALSFLNITGSVRDWLQIEPMPMKPLKVNPEPEGDNSQSSTPMHLEENKEDVPHSSNTIFISDWLPPEQLKCDEFIAVPTYIDDHGVIYLHDISQQDTLEIIRNSLEVRFRDPDPKAKFVKWAIGEPCVAQFFLDNHFYRGRILEVNNEELSCLIHYVDYGNDEPCSFENLRKSIALYNIPIQAYRCVLNGIRPVGNNWNRQTLDYIHKCIVEKQCYVKVCGEPIGGLIPIELEYNKFCINHQLVDLELAKYVDGTKAAVHLFAPPSDLRNIEETAQIDFIESESGPDYIVGSDLDHSFGSQMSIQLKCLDLEGKDWYELVQDDEHGGQRFVVFPPFVETEFLCKITVLNEKDKLELSVVHDCGTEELYDKMYTQLQSEVHKTTLNGIFENKACLACPEDNHWYRAIILECSEAKKLIKVKLIDYGNTIVIPLDNVREIGDEYLELPPATITVTLNGVNINPKLDVKTVAEILAKTFVDKEDPFHVKVIEANAIPVVELRDTYGKLIYNDLFEEEVFLKSDFDI